MHGIPRLLLNEPSDFPFNLKEVPSLHSLLEGSSADMECALREEECGWQEARAPQVRAWEANLANRLASESIRISQLGQLVSEGAAAHDLSVELVGASDTPVKLAEVVALHRRAKEWVEGAGAAALSLSAAPQPPEALRFALAELEGSAEDAGAPLVAKLREAISLRKRLSAAEAWVQRARKTLDEPSDLRDLQDLAKDLEGIRVLASLTHLSFPIRDTAFFPSPHDRISSS